ncbi:hypothetical protein LAZ40_22585 [Cereibacter sphaeroides]|uniref:hypothetical protein n=1 Tax=Cereibacter sphaeroides TaxID=1063 RepID=UPI001F2BADB5|nr:hypothetical protein [Cereibacter sphaeroides]MCE6953074.1 hypothetical protein [Cereibacter sphaeroides]MCE6961827.1 hypothetical protein [Cereibacter sphaeroides]MCE6970602.1 hypothetical protein [Cereibacter sphaeroides]MCE6975802.1 hypothetical protein [Cereibacter sphaeroides]
MTARNHPDEPSKDAFFARIAELSDEMIAAHGRDFAVGALVLAARFICDRTPDALNRH